jgi:hypothetical protein
VYDVPKRGSGGTTNDVQPGLWSGARGDGFALVSYLSDAPYVRMHRIALISIAARRNSALRTLRRSDRNQDTYNPNQPNPSPVPRLIPLHSTTHAPPVMFSNHNLRSCADRRKHVRIYACSSRGAPRFSCADRRCGETQQGGVFLAFFFTSPARG